MQLIFRRPQRTQYAALCFREVDHGLEILLLTSRDTGRWVIPKGWPMGAKSGHEVARQEALEEAGALGDMQPVPLGRFCYQKRMEGDPCSVEVFAMRFTSQVETFKEKGKRKIAWFSPEDAAERVAEPQLKDLIRRFARGMKPLS